MARLNPDNEAKLVQFAQALVNQQAARVAIMPQAASPGYWFGGGNLIQDADGPFYLVGRYRNYGDSRTGLGAGERGRELAIFRAPDRTLKFEKILSFSKADLDVEGRRVLSIEGSALHRIEGGVELFVSSEKAGIDYPPGLQSFLKPQTGVWTIERLQAQSVEGLNDAPLETVLQSSDPEHLHVKDPAVYDAASGDLVLLFCTHPYCWSSSNTACALRAPRQQALAAPRFGFFPRGFTWDVAITRGTALVDVPQVGAFHDLRATLLFYDGGESLRNLDEHARAVKRPRGYSCEELGGVAYLLDGDLTEIHRLSRNLPLFVSPHGTGCSRYVDVLRTADGFFASWQQSQPDRSQPLVINFVSHDEVGRILA